MRRKQSLHQVLTAIAVVGFGSAYVSQVVAGPAAQPADSNQPAAAGDVRDQQISDLKKALDAALQTIGQLTDRVDRLEKGKAAGGGVSVPPTPGEVTPGQPPPLPPIALPGEPGTSTETPPLPSVELPTGESAPPRSSGGGASFTPDISVIGDNDSRFISVQGDPDRNRMQLGEFEMGLQQPVYPGIRFDAFITGDPGSDFTLSAEEAYITVSKVPNTPLGALLGLKRLDFDKQNPVHPHARPWTSNDQPSSMNNFLGPDGISGNGGSLNYTVPVNNLFANLEFGVWDVNPDTGDAKPFTTSRGSVIPGAAPAAAAGSATTLYQPGLGISGNLPLGRLWVSKALDPSSELELGASDAFGKADIGDRINITGIDATYRHFPSTFQRFMLQGEAIVHHRIDDNFGTGGHTRDGGYLFASYRMDQFIEYGVRYDNSQFSWPFPGSEQCGSLILTDHITEGTLLRLEYKLGSRGNSVYLPESGHFNEILLQFIWAAGSHTHPLQ